jgi:hypothetical protein
MPRFVKGESAQRWNRAASIVEAGGAGSHFVPQTYRPPQGAGGGGGEIVIIIARATADVTASDSTFSAKIKATICGTPQTFDADITVENLAPGDYTTPTVSGDYVTTSTENVFLLLEGMNFIAVKANTDSVSFPGSGAPKTGWFILQAPGTYADCS